MNKALALSATGVGASSAVVGGYYLVGSGVFGSTSKDETEETKKVSITQPSTLLIEWKNSQPSEEACVKNFSGLKDLKAEDANIKTIDGANNKIDKAFFSATGESISTKGCLTFKQDKKSYANGSNWSGNFKLTWTFEKENKGFIAFVAAKEIEKGKLGLVGLFYALSQTDSNWSITHKKEVASHKEVISSNIATHFPKVGKLLTDLSDKPWWEWFSSEEDIANVCVDGAPDCNNSSETVNRSQGWTWTKATAATTGKLEEWSENLGSWWNNLFSDSDINMPGIVAEEKAAVTISSLVGE